MQYSNKLKNENRYVKHLSTHHSFRVLRVKGKQEVRNSVAELNHITEPGVWWPAVQN